MFIVEKLNIIDFSYIYTKYKFATKQGSLTQLTFKDRDITLLYYPTKEIEAIYKRDENVDSAICFDCTYANFVSKYNPNVPHTNSSLTQSDYTNASEIRYMLEQVGHTTYMDAKTSSEMLIHSIMYQHQDSYNEIHIYTANLNLLAYVSDKVTVHLYRQKMGYIDVTPETFENDMALLFKTFVPYNTLLLYLTLCGNTNTRTTKGVKGFGKSAFNKLCQSGKVDNQRCTDIEYIYTVVTELFQGEKQKEKLDQALQSINDIRPRYLDKPVIKPTYDGNLSTRVDTYTLFGMASCV